jgi:RNA polymerase sigma factor (sigma-70 family)
MQAMDDMTLLREYAANNSETAFEELVSRRLNFVYSSALRQVRDPHLAGEITQAVFIILAQKAGRISDKTILTGWFFRTTRFAALAHVRAEAKRSLRTAIVEKELQMQTENSSAVPDGIWNQMSPLLDEALVTLGEKDRQAVLLRFFENRSLAEVGNKLGMGEDTARKRVSRALEKLNRYFAKRGVNSTAETIAGAISTNSVQAAPVALTKSVTAVAFAKGAAASGSTLTLIKGALKIMAWTKAKTAIVVGVIALLAAGTASVAVFDIGKQNREAMEILEHMSQKYASQSSYSSNGTTVEEIEKKTITASFTMRLGRTNLYFVEYEQHAPTFTNEAAAWSDGSGDYFLNEWTNKTLKAPGPGSVNMNKIHKFLIPGPANNLGNTICNVSGGATIIVPSMFFGFPTPSLWSSWSWLFDGTNWSSKTRFSKEPDEKVGDADCYVFSSGVDDKMIGKMTLWIGKEDFLLHKSRERLTDKLPEATDSEVKQLEAAETPPLPIEEMKRRINEGQKKAMTTMKPVTVIFSTDNKTGVKSMTIQPPNVIVFTQTYENISVNQNVSPSDFRR